MQQQELWTIEDKASYTKANHYLGIVPRNKYKNPPQKAPKKDIMQELKDFNNLKHKKQFSYCSPTERTSATPTSRFTTSTISPNSESGACGW